MLLSPSHKIFLDRLLDLEASERGHATVAACTIGVVRRARVLRVHDARAASHAARPAAAALQDRP